MKLTSYSLTFIQVQFTVPEFIFRMQKYYLCTLFLIAIIIMINIRRKTVLTTFVLTGSAIIILSIGQSFKGFSKGFVAVNQQSDTIYYVKSFKLPEEVTFADEKMPLNNFDTRESH